MKTFIEPTIEEWDELTTRPALNNESLKGLVADIIQNVKERGDKALIDYSEKFDKVILTDIKISNDDLENAVNFVNEEIKRSILTAKSNIEKFHITQKEKKVIVETSIGVSCWRNSVAIEKVGLYIPGGTAPLFSTLLMLAIPAKIAGCSDIIICSPPNKDGNIDHTILYVANILGIKNVYKVGGAQAIAAMAYGTQTIPKVYKIFGPGNQFVTAAKQIINSTGVAIDMPAGPSEVAIYADETSKIDFVAADLLSQAEHGVDSQVILVANNKPTADAIIEQLNIQTELLQRKNIIKEAIEKSRCIILKDQDNAFHFLNSYAPEHLIIASDHAEILSEKVINAGSVFLGHYSPESVGDYASGTNHTLPTNGFARAYSGVSVDSFVKKITFQQLTKEGLNNIGPAVEIMADAEGLHAHKNAVTIRLKSFSK